MTIAPGRRPETEVQPEDLIREARRRQRRRYAIVIFGVLVLVAGVTTGLALAGGPRAAPSGPRADQRPAAQAGPAGPHAPPLVPGIGTSLLMWPSGPTAFDHGGPPALVEDLGTGRISRSGQPAISPGDFQPLLVRTGHWFVYVGQGTTVIRDDLRSRPRELAATPFFAPAAEPGRLWLFRSRAATRGPVRAWTVPISGGPPSAPVTLPAGAALPAVRGTDAGLLLSTPAGLGLWRPGGAPAPLPYVPGFAAGFDASPRLVAYGTGCAEKSTAANAPYEPNAGYETCRMLRVLDVVTGKVISFPAPGGTTGWVPAGFNLVSAISPNGSMIAAYAAPRPLGTGRVRLYLIRTGSARTAPRLVPSSGAFLFARTAWSDRGGWLFYQGPGGQLSAYQPATGTTRRSRMTCCQFTVMVSAPSDGPSAG
ncbi:MAG: hypothetical protein ACR2FU_20290 [Streptosporangiaceae bacterium]